jgi:cytochrome c-type biogenesis protein CcmH/NrfF
MNSALRWLSSVLVGLALLLPGVAAAASPQTTLPDIEDEVMCVECGTVLNISTSQVADDQREFIQQRIDRGESKEEIKAALVAEFGPDVIAMPDREGFNLAVYLVPAALGLIGLVGVVLAARRWRARRPASPAAATGDDGRSGRLEPDQEQRLAAELAAFDS